LIIGTSIQFIDYVLSRLPFKAEVIQTDNSAEFQGQFHWYVLDKGINHVYIKPRSPRLNGKVERSNRIDKEEFYRMLNGVVIDDANLFNEKLQEAFETIVNLSKDVGIPQHLREIHIAAKAMPGMDVSAAKVTRLLNNNPCEMTVEDIEKIYRFAY